MDQEKHSRDSSGKNKSTSGREQIQKRKNGGVNIPLGLWVRLIGLEARVQTRKDLGWERQGLCSKVNLHINKVLQSCIVTYTFTFHLFTPECSLSHICSSQPSIVHWLSSPIFPCSVVWLFGWLFGCSSRYGDTRPNLTSSCPTPPNPYIF